MNFHNHHHHLFKRKSSTSFLDRTCLLFSILMPATALPQIYKTFTFKDVSGLSLSMWVLYCVGVIPFLFYGIVHRELPIIVLNILWLIAQITMIVGIVMYM